MAWSSSAPSLPSGESWGNTQTYDISANHFRTQLTTQSARGIGNTFYIKVSVYWTKGDNGDFYPPNPTYYIAAGEATSIGGPSEWSTVTRYFSGAVASSTSYTVGVSQYNTYIPSGMAKTTQPVAAPKYWTISYNGNSATSGSTASQTKVRDTTLTLQSNGYTRTGYHFIGWNTAADGTGTSYAAGGSYTSNAATTLYAQWAVDTYAVTYNGNENTGGSTAAQTKTYNIPLALRDNGFIKKSHIFVHWNTEADDTGTTYTPGENYTANTALTLYAIWEKANIPVFVNINGTIKQVEKAYTNINGTIKETTMYVNIDNTIKSLT